MQVMIRAMVLAAAVFCAGTPALAAGPYDLTPEGNARFLADFATRKDVTKLPGGLMYRVLQSGNDQGTSPISRYDTVTVEYRGWLLNGHVFDQTRPDEPRTFQAGGVIKGWSEALFKMKAGDEWQLVIPAELAYGDDGVGNAIPPEQTLIFTVRLVKVEYAP